MIFTDKEMLNLIAAKLIQVRRPAWKAVRYAGDQGKPTHWLKVVAGQHLWVAEGYAVTDVLPREARGYYKADNFPFLIKVPRWLPPSLSSIRARQNHTMPVEASRFTLEVYFTAVELDTCILNCRVIDRNIAEIKKVKAA